VFGEARETGGSFDSPGGSTERRLETDRTGTG
jgi:hypothetical protein